LEYQVRNMVFKSMSSLFKTMMPVLGFTLLTVAAWLQTQPGSAQVLDQLSDLLQQPPPPDSSTDELPSPQRNAEQHQPNAPASPDTAQRIYLGLEAEEQPNSKGLRVATVTRGSPAWRAGFQVDDRIIGIDGVSITTMEDMIAQLGKARPGQSILFLINRLGRTRELTAVLISQAMADEILSRSEGLQEDSAWIGLTVHDLTSSFREQFGIAAYSGAAISQVVAGSPAHRAGIKAGDAITEIDARPVESAEDFVKWLQTARPGDQVAMIIYRGISKIPVQVVLSSEPRPQPTQPTFRPVPPRPPAARRGAQAQEKDAAEISGNPPQTVEAAIATTELGATPRELQLQAEVDRLKQELADAQAKLDETRQQLNSILRSLRE
jgi:S1-C subfamily serine protease